MNLAKFLIFPSGLTKQRSAIVFWLVASLLFAAFCGFLGLQEAFREEYVVQDDARQHVFWMLRFLDGELFPNDLIADYFQAVAPPGYTGIYWLMAQLGIDPFLVNKLIPILLGLIATGYCFGIVWQIFPVPLAGFFASMLLNQSLWMKDDLVSATPRAFVYPLFLAFLYYLLKSRIVATSIAIALLGLFYPQYVLVSAGLLIIRLFFSNKDYLLTGVGLVVAGAIVSYYALTSSDFAPVISPELAKTLPEFGEGGRSAFFQTNLWSFYFLGTRSGFLHVGLVNPPTLCFWLFLPILNKFPKRFPLVNQITPKVALLWQLLIVGTGLFILAHLLLFKLHLPSRYTEHTLRIAVAIAAGIAFTIIFAAVSKLCQQQIRHQGRVAPLQGIILATTYLLIAAIVLYPIWEERFPVTKYKIGHEPQLYEFFQQQPKDILIASTAQEANNLPSFAQRSILVGREYAIPYHLGYYNQFRQRVRDLIKAQYSPELTIVTQFINKYQINFWLLDRNAFSLEYLQNQWVEQYPPTSTQAEANLAAGKTPILATISETCAVFETDNLIILETKCILER
ncbi:MAG: hypothetical protein SAJ37_09580 [Oscillatoria sp. PMC 1068.18]|nr:hypothetical protein [Oscillatoria sp. PMC 1076.18]MEC4988985.1 hypothetical protein [Oscillatoria sp. PMC 1068.18]